MDKLQHWAMAGVSRAFRSDLAEKLKLRPFIERQAYTQTKLGFKALTAVAKRRRKPLKALPSPPKAVFDLSLNEEQQQLCDMVESFALEQLRPAAYEADKHKTIAADVRQQWLELGANYMAVPEAYGGMAAKDKTVTLALLTEKLAQGDLSMAYSLLTTVSVLNCLERWGSDEQKQHYLSEFLHKPEMQASMACFEQGYSSEASVKTKAQKTKNTYRLNGLKSMVPMAAEADYFIVSAELSNQLRLFIVPADASGLTIRPIEAMGLKACQLAELELNHVELAQANLLQGDFNTQTFLQLNQLSWCALSVGCAQACVDYVIDYANQRTAFGEPISHRQSVAFAIADMALELEAMRLMFWRACNQIDLGLDAAKQTRLASLLCTDKGMMIGTQAVQLLGGHGFTKEHPVERWYRDIRAMAIAANAQL